MTLKLTLLAGRFAVCRLAADDPVPAWAGLQPGASGLVSITRTDGELSVVCPEAGVPDGVTATRGWAALAVAGPLDHSLTGVLASLAGPLADAGVPIFAVSTYDTDLLLVRGDDLGAARRALQAAGHTVVDAASSAR